MKKQYSYNSKKVYSVADVDIPRDKIELLKEIFHLRKDSNEYISIYNSIVVMKEMGFTINEEKKLEIVKYVNQDFLRFDNVRKLFNYLNTSENLIRNSENHNTDYADAFIAVGGNEDLSGVIHISDIRQIFQNFHLEMSINSLLEKNDLKGVQEVDFNTFCKLFSDTVVEDSKSFFTLISVRYYIFLV